MDFGYSWKIAHCVKLTVTVTKQTIPCYVVEYCSFNVEHSLPSSRYRNGGAGTCGPGLFMEEYSNTVAGCLHSEVDRNDRKCHQEDAVEGILLSFAR